MKLAFRPQHSDTAKESGTEQDPKISPDRQVSALFATLFVAILFGSAFPGLRTVYNHWDKLNVDVTLFTLWLFAGLRFTLAGLSLVCLSKQPIKDLRATPLKLLILFTLTQTVFHYLFFYVGVHVSSGSLAALLGSTGSFWWLILAPIILKSPFPNKKQWAAIAIGATALSIAIYKPGTGAGNPWLGAVMIVTGNFSATIGIILFSKIKRTMGSKSGSGFALLFGGIVLIFIGAPAWAQITQMFDFLTISVTLWLAIVSAAGFAIWNHLSTLYPVSLLATYRFLIPLCGVILSILFLPNETPGWGLVIGTPFLLFSLYLAQRFSKS